MCIKTQFKLNGSDIGHVAVRKHRAPKGALRRKTYTLTDETNALRRKSPSAKRCIKTCSPKWSPIMFFSPVRKHRAPNGALRPVRQFNFGSHA